MHLTGSVLEFLVVLNVADKNTAGKLRQARGQFVDLVGTEARPVVFISDHNGRLEVAQRLDLLERCRVDRKVEDLIFDAPSIQRAAGSVALHA